MNGSYRHSLWSCLKNVTRYRGDTAGTPAPISLDAIRNVESENDMQHVKKTKESQLFFSFQ